MLGGAALGHVAIFAGLFRGVYSIPYSGTGLFYEYAGRVLAGQLPYRDFFAEYPPLAIGIFTVPRMLGESFRWFYVWYQVEVVIADLLIVVALYLAARRWALSPWMLIAVYTAAVLAVGPINLQQFDIFPAALSLFAVLRFASDDAIGAGVLLALAVMTKVYPLLLAPMFVLLAWRQHRHGVTKAIVAFVMTSIAVLLPWLVRGPASLRGMLSFHAERGTHLDSVYSTIAFAARALGLTWVNIVYNFRSWNISGPVPDVLARISTAMLLAMLAAAYGVIYWTARDRSDAARDVRFIGHGALVVLLVAMIASKVLSPQYLVWLTPFVPFVIGPRQRAVWAAFIVTGLLTYWLYPWRYDALLNRETSALALLAARNIALVATTVLAVISLRRAPVESSP
jgi:uncharacterized membrane protein